MSCYQPNRLPFADPFVPSYASWAGEWWYYCVMWMSRLVWEWLAAGPFTGRLLSQHDHSLNLFDEAGRVLTLLRPSLPMGPYAIRLPPGAAWPATEGQIQLSLDPTDSAIDLTGATIWDPVVVWPAREKWPAAVWPLLAPYAAWPALDHQPAVLASQLRQKAAQLQQAWHTGNGLAEAMLELVGLGNGLTPAGDDYLVGFIIATSASYSDIPKTKLPHTHKRTTTLSATFLQAASQGSLTEPWHQLASALSAADPAAIQTALHQIAGQGATSGQDALAGFAQTLVRSQTTGSCE